MSEADTTTAALEAHRTRAQAALRQGRLKEAFVELASVLGSRPPTQESGLLFHRAFVKENRPDHIALMFAAAMLEHGDTDTAAMIYQLVRRNGSNGREFLVATPDSDLPRYCEETGAPIEFLPGFNLKPMSTSAKLNEPLPAFVAGLPGGRIAGDTFYPVSNDGRMFFRSIAFNPIKVFKYDNGDAAECVAVPAHSRYLLRPSSRSTHGPAIHLGHTRNIGHWLLNHVARLALIEHRSDLRDLPVVVAAGPSSMNFETLARLGFDAGRVIRVQPAELAQFEMLWVPSQLFCQIDERPALFWNSGGLHFVRRKLGVGDPPPGRRRLFITRRTAQWRRVVNEDAVYSILQPFGFEMVDPGTLSLAQQIELAADAAIIVGAFGNGMNLSLFAPRGSAVVELGFPELTMRIQQATCSVLSQHYYAVEGQSESTKRVVVENDFTVDPQIVRLTIRAALATS